MIHFVLREGKYTHLGCRTAKCTVHNKQAYTFARVRIKNGLRSNNRQVTLSALQPFTADDDMAYVLFALMK